MCGVRDDLLLWERMSEGGLEEAQARMQDGKVIFQEFVSFFLGRFIAALCNLVLVIGLFLWIYVAIARQRLACDSYGSSSVQKSQAGMTRMYGIREAATS
jgi:hypothetical protein